MAGTTRNRTNPETPPEDVFPSLDDVLSELKNWEDQLQDVDFDALDDDGADDHPATHGGPTPC